MYVLVFMGAEGNVENYPQPLFHFIRWGRGCLCSNPEVTAVAALTATLLFLPVLELLVHQRAHAAFISVLILTLAEQSLSRSCLPSPAPAHSTGV